MLKIVDFGRSNYPAFLVETPSLSQKIQNIIRPPLPFLNACSYSHSLLSYGLLVLHSKDLAQECVDLLLARKDWKELKPKMQQTTAAVCLLALSIRHPYLYLICTEIKTFLAFLQQPDLSLASLSLQLFYLFSLLGKAPTLQAMLEQPNDNTCRPDLSLTRAVLEGVSIVPLLFRNIQDLKTPSPHNLLILTGRVFQVCSMLYANRHANTLASLEYKHVLQLAKSDFFQQARTLILQVSGLMAILAPIAAITFLVQRIMYHLSKSDAIDKQNYCIGRQGPPISMKDIVGCEKAKRSVARLIDKLKSPEAYRQLGPIHPTKGILFFGPPGTGKSMLAKALATEIGNAVFLSQAGSAFVELYIGKGAQSIRALFAQAKKMAEEDPKRLVVIFIDEINAIGRERNAHLNSGAEIENINTTEAFLVEIDETLPNVIVIGTTNMHPHALDPAFTRSGRFDQHIEFQLPTVEERLAIFLQLASVYKFTADMNQEYWAAAAAQTADWCYADFTNLMGRAADEAGFQKQEAITKAIYEQAFRNLQAQKQGGL